VTVWARAWISMVGERRAVYTNFLIDRAISSAIHRLTVRAANTDHGYIM
jgi:hypothetical protein